MMCVALAARIDNLDGEKFGGLILPRGLMQDLHIYFTFIG